MNSTTIRYKMLASALLVSGLGWFGSANAATETLCAGEYTKMVDGVSVTMWGYATGGATAGVCDNMPTSPGPDIVVPAGDTTLSVTLHNTLSRLSGSVPEPTSLIIPGQSATMTPVVINGRVRSFTDETATGTSLTYNWTIKPGTYAYQSGTHPAVQVQMGLYGAMTQDYPGVSYDTAVTLLYSEVDPAMHADIVANAVGSNDGTALSTINYAPRYFLVNGEVYSGGTSQDYSASAPGERTLVRFINMGLKMHAPTINGARVEVIAEDGNLYPYSRDQYSVRLAAGKTKDAIITVPADDAGARYAVYDRMLNLSNDGAVGAGGMMSFLVVGATSAAPPVFGEVYPATEDTLLGIVAPGVLANDCDNSDITLPSCTGTVTLVSDVGNGSLALAADGSFTYMPGQDFFGTDSFVYSASDGSASATAMATINVANVNDAPVAVNDDYAMTQDTVLSIAADGVLGNDTDADGDALTAVSYSAPSSGGLAALADGSFDYTPIAGFTGSATFTYSANDGTVNSDASATVTITVAAAPANELPVAADDSYPDSLPRGGTTDPILVLANDTDADGTLVPSTVTIVTPPDGTRGTATANDDGTITFISINDTRPGKPPRKGTATFTYTVDDNDGGTSNVATVRVNVN